jgi:hypothetical protein
MLTALICLAAVLAVIVSGLTTVETLSELD